MFVSQLNIEDTGKRRAGRPVYRLTSPFCFVVNDVDGFDFNLIVPEGFETDLASIPARLQWLLKPTDLGPAATAHDWLYTQGNVSRHLADSIFRLIMLARGHSWAKRVGAYLAVRAFGWRHKTTSTGE